MRILLDTHLVLWWLTGDRKLPRAAQKMISDRENEIYVSAASIWEVAIKANIGRIDVDPAEVRAAIGPSGFLDLAVTSKHAVKVAELPFHHRDPFDRLLIAQSLSEPMLLLSSDRLLKPYGNSVAIV